MFDIHCHMLPDADDGADSIETACTMAQAAADDGVRAVILTPHCSAPDAPFYLPAEQILEKTERFKTELSLRSIALDVLPGAEVLATPQFPYFFAHETFLTLNGSRYFLVEFDFEEEPDFTLYILDLITAAGLVPIVAHPERYLFLETAPWLPKQWKQIGALLQLDKGSLNGHFGKDAQYAAVRLLTSHMADVIASDAHGPLRRTPVLSHCKNAVKKLCDEGYVKELFTKMPARILDDLPPDYRRCAGKPNGEDYE